MPTINELLSSAVCHHTSGNLAQAEALYRQILLADPTHASALHLLGIVAFQTGRRADASALIEQAIQSYQHAALAHPDDADVRNNLGRALKDQGQVDEAIESYRAALRINSNHADARNNLGIALFEQSSTLFNQGQIAEGSRLCREALQINPNHAEGHYNLGIALVMQGEIVEAAVRFRQAVRLEPNYADAYSSLGNVLKELGHLDEALECCRQALRINPDHADAHVNMGAALCDQGKLAQAEECYCQALRIDPDHALAHVNLAFLGLVQGDFAGGWPDFEHRFALPDRTVRSFQQPRWDGAPLDGKTVLVYAEQGLGDTIQFIRYARLVKEGCGRVVLECQPSLVRLLEGVAGVDQIVPRKSDAQSAHLPHFDVQAPLMSLPGILGTTLPTIPCAVPYLRADAELARRWGRELAALDGFKIGIAWQGNPHNARDRQRSVPLSYFEPLARLQGVRLVSVQKGLGTEQPGNSCHFGPIVDFGDRLDATGAFLDTSAVLMNLDLVVTVDSAVAHLAGALGVPAWILLADVADWRWLLERCDSPWYPTVRLFRQRTRGDWREVFERVAGEIRGLIEEE